MQRMQERKNTIIVETHARALNKIIIIFFLSFYFRYDDVTPITIIIIILIIFGDRVS